jgi:hypothetical protein
MLASERVDAWFTRKSTRLSFFTPIANEIDVSLAFSVSIRYTYIESIEMEELYEQRTRAEARWAQRQSDIRTVCAGRIDEGAAAWV